MAKKNWIKRAVAGPFGHGALHRALNIKPGKKIPLKSLRSAARGNSRTARRARLALTLRKFK